MPFSDSKFLPRMADEPPKTTAQPATTTAAVQRPRRPPSHPMVTTLVVAGPSGYVPVTASPTVRPRVVTTVSGVYQQQVAGETRMTSVATGQPPRMPAPGYAYAYPPPVTSPGFPPQAYGQHSFAAMAPYGYAAAPPPPRYRSALLDSLPEAPNIPGGYAYGKDTGTRNRTYTKTRFFFSRRASGAVSERRSSLRCHRPGCRRPPRCRRLRHG